jgi:iduronate 2-sulfatase
MLPILGLALAATLPLAAAAQAERLNVLFIVSDDLRPEMGCYGGQAITPHLDKFAASAGAVLFERSYVQQAICCPTRSSFLTGRRPDTTKVWDLHTHFRASGGRDWTTLPEYFKEKGYYTAGMGKVFHPVKDPATGLPNDVGFSWTAPYFAQGASAPQSMAMCWNERGNGTTDAPCNGGPHTCTADGTIAAHGVALLQNASKYPDVPFFIAVGIHRPHLPWDVPAHWYSLYPAAEDIALADHNSPPADYGPARNYSWDPQSGPRHCGPLKALSDPEDPKMG